MKVQLRGRSRETRGNFWCSVEPPTARVSVFSMMFMLFLEDGHTAADSRPVRSLLTMKDGFIPLFLCLLTGPYVACSNSNKSHSN